MVANHKLSVTDIQNALDKLLEICPDNVFSSIPSTWTKNTIQELEDAVAAGACCCEETDIVFPGDLNAFVTSGGYRVLEIGPVTGRLQRL